MTLKEYVEEIKISPYTIDSFELAKESIELNLAAMYLDSYNFIQENKIVNDNLIYIYTESGSSDIEAKKQSFWNRAIAFLKKVLGIILRPFGVIYSILNKFGNMFREKITSTKKFISKTKSSIRYMDDPDFDIEHCKKQYIITFQDLNKQDPSLFEMIKDGKFDTITADIDLEEFDDIFRKTGMSEEKIQFTNNLIKFIFGVTVDIPTRISMIGGNYKLFMEPFQKICDMKEITDVDCEFINKAISDLDDRIIQFGNTDTEKCTLEDVNLFENNFKDIYKMIVKAKEHITSVTSQNSEKVNLSNINKTLAALQSFANEMNGTVNEISDSCRKNLDYIGRASSWYQRIVMAPKMDYKGSEE